MDDTSDDENKTPNVRLIRRRRVFHDDEDSVPDLSTLSLGEFMVWIHRPIPLVISGNDSMEN